MDALAKLVQEKAPASEGVRYQGLVNRLRQVSWRNSCSELLYNPDGN